MLEQTIVKIGALLALGFGEAGSKIIAENMSKGSQGDVDPMIPGQRINAIFGFCDIRRFTDTTECLQEGVMLFTNEVGEIVHGIVNSFSGAANKNIGDAFLLVWKFFDVEDE
jgi:class 3 adenylate cyclase